MQKDLTQDDIAFLRHLISRPVLYIGVREGTALLAFINGYCMARAKLGSPPDMWGEIFEKVRLALNPSMSPENSHTVGMVLRRVSGGDEKKAFDLLADAIRKEMPPEAASEDS